MSNDRFLVRARRALRRRPRDLAQRALASVQRRARRPWASVTPRLFNDAALLRATGADSIDDLWSRLKEQPFFLSPSMRREWTDVFVDRYPAARDVILREAEAILHHEFDLLGSGRVAFGSRLPWHVDFKTGEAWAIEYACEIPYARIADLDRPTDVKVPWELSRCQHFAVLGQAYWLSGDERFAEEFVAEVEDWIASNPWAYGVNWACAMDIALRAVSWLWGFYFFCDAAACRSAAFRSRLLRSLFLHGEYIATHLEKGEVNGNHYLCDGVGLVFLGVFFAAARKGRRWLDIGREIVVDEIELQTTADGVDFEQATAYHRLVLEAFSTAYLLLRAAGEVIPAAAWNRLERMHEFVQAYTKPDGSVPLIGDADDGRIQKLGAQSINDHRYLLSTGAVLFNRGDFKATATRFWEESFWLLGPAGFDSFSRIVSSPPAGSRAFPLGGIYVLRNDTAHVVIDCAEVGMQGRGGHGHNDILSFELWMNGANWVTDCGAYVYTASREWRNRFRSTAFHNTVQVDGEELNRFIGPDALWQLRYDAAPLDPQMVRGPDVDRFSGSHTGYLRLLSPVSVTREIVLDHVNSRVRVQDTVGGHGSHEVISRFHLDPAVAAEVDGRRVHLRSHGKRLSLHIDTQAAMSVVLEGGWVSPSYGVKVPTTTIVCFGNIVLPAVLTYTFSDPAGSCVRS